jgi:hypothetical protein
MAVTIAYSKPAFCSACFASKPDATFVDFGAAYDGPAIRDDAGTIQRIDDLIVCEDCVREGALQLALLVQPTREIELERDAAREAAKEWRAYAETLEETVAHRPAPIKRPPGRPRKGSERPTGLAV